MAGQAQRTRWQETMFNLVLIGGADDAVKALSRSIEVGLEDHRRKVVDVKSIESMMAKRVMERDEAGRLRPKVTATGLKREAAARVLDEAEPPLSDRVELASRIVRQAGPARRTVVAALTGPLQAAISQLAEKGNPITQVKMMRACQNLPRIGPIGSLRALLDSPVSWVTNQALILSTSNPDAFGSDLATVIGYDLANGRIATRFPTHVRAAIASQRSGVLVVPRHWPGLLPRKPRASCSGSRRRSSWWHGTTPRGLGSPCGRVSTPPLSSVGPFSPSSAPRKCSGRRFSSAPQGVLPCLYSGFPFGTTPRWRPCSSSAC